MNAVYGGDKAFVLGYGASKLGKSSDMLFSFPTALFIARPGALKPAYNLCGYEPTWRNAKDIADARKILREEVKKAKYSAIVVDDGSILADGTVAAIGKSKSGFELWGAVKNELLGLRDEARDAGLHVAINTHEASPRTTNGQFQRGGPKLPGKLPEEFPAACDIALRAVYDAQRKGWHGCYRCSVDDSQYVTGDRHSVTPDRAPMNVGEILRLAGYDLPRLKGLEWQEDVVAAISEALLANEGGSGGEKEILAQAVEICSQYTSDERHIRWVLRDSVDRTFLLRTRQNPYKGYL